jgi:hypothetical protein
MAGGQKADFVVKIKDAADKSAKPVSLGAWWREGDRLQGGWDRGVAKVQIRMVDGTVHTITPSEEGGRKRWSHFLNAYDNGGDAGRPARGARPDTGGAWDDGGKGDPGPGDDDHLPF